METTVNSPPEATVAVVAEDGEGMVVVGGNGVVEKGWGVVVVRWAVEKGVEVSKSPKSDASISTIAFKSSSKSMSEEEEGEEEEEKK